MFKKLKTEDYPLLRDFFDIYGWSLCEYSLSSIIAWNHCIYDVHYRVEGDLLFISEIEIEKPENRRLLLPLTRPFRRPLPAELAGWAAKLGYRQYYYATEDYLAQGGVCFIEWADRISPLLPAGALSVRFMITGEALREIDLPNAGK